MAKSGRPESQIAGECLAGRVRVLSRVVTGVYDDALRPHGVRITQMSVLVAIAAMGPVQAGDVCRRLRLEKSSLSRELDRLLEHGWVRSTPAAGRVQMLEATSEGRDLIAKVKPAWDGAQSRVRELLGEDLADGILKSVERMRTADADLPK